VKGMVNLFEAVAEYVSYCTEAVNLKKENNFKEKTTFYNRLCCRKK
jgi:hypothetical protein